MTPYDYQVAMSESALSILRQHAIVYLAAEERTGKTLTAILTAEATQVQTVLVVTKKKALDGWNDTLKAFPHNKKYTVTNYHQAYKQPPHDLVIVDEAHNYISSYPKPGKIWKEMRVVCAKKPLIYLSATPYAQGPQLLYHQLALSTWSPFRKYTSFYNWFKQFGKPYTREINGIQIPQYDRCDTPLILGCVEHLFITKTRQELGFDYEPTDKLHYIELSEPTKAVYNELMEHNIVELKAGMLVCDTTAKLRASLHMLEGGVAKIEEDRIILANREKIDYILEHWGDHEGLVIMYQYIAEKAKLESVFKKATVLQATSYAEGVDLHKFSDLVIYSQDFSTARHAQRRARQANKKRDTPITVHFLLVKKGLSEQVYKTVSVNKKNFIDSVFKRTKL
jgi:hypothetical protein